MVNMVSFTLSSLLQFLKTKISKKKTFLCYYPGGNKRLGVLRSFGQFCKSGGLGDDFCSCVNYNMSFTCECIDFENYH